MGEVYRAPMRARELEVPGGAGADLGIHHVRPSQAADDVPPAVVATFRPRRPQPPTQ